MATRGIYKVENQLLYNHWDNYPVGAAYHLSKVASTQHKFDLFSVIRGMSETSPANSIYNSGAEYYYEIFIKNDKYFINCYTIEIDRDAKKLHSSGELINWINSLIIDDLKNDTENDPNDYILVELHNNYFDTVNNCKKEILLKYDHAVECFKKGWIGNSSSAFSETFKIANRTKINIDQLKSEYLSIYSGAFAQAYKHSDRVYFDSVILEN